MNLTAIVYLVCSIAFSGFVASSAHGACSKLLTFGFPKLELPKSHHTSIDPAHIDTAIFKEIMRLSSCSYILETVPWKRVTEAIRHGQIDGTFDVSKTDDRQSFGHFSMPYREETIGIAMRKNDIASFNPTSFSDIVSSNLRFGSTIGFWYGPEFETAQKSNRNFNGKLLRSPDSTSMAAWLLKNRVDLYFIDTNAAHHLINTRRLEKEIGLHPFILNRNGLHILLGKTTTQPSDIEAINNGVAKLLDSKTYKMLMRVFERGTMLPAERNLLMDILQPNKR